jgi:hypothetical protein
MSNLRDMMRLQRLLRHQTRGLEIWKPYSESRTVTMGPGLVETDVKSDAVWELTAGQLMDLGWSVDSGKGVWVFTELYKKQPATVAG